MAPKHQRRRGSSGPARRTCEATPLLKSGAISDLEKNERDTNIKIKSEAKLLFVKIIKSLIINYLAFNTSDII